MPINVTMPRLSDTMEQGTVVKWHVKEGDKVSSGDVIADIETDKATMEQSVFDDGVIARLVCPEGKQVKVGELIAVLAVDGESAADAARAAAPENKPGMTGAVSGAPAAKASAAPAREIVAEATASVVEAADGMRVSPVARRMAQELGVDLAQVRGSGPNGRVIKRDIQAAAENRSAAAPAARAVAAAVPGASAAGGLVAAAPTAVASASAAPASGALVAGVQSVEIPVTGMRQVIARRLVESTQQIPHYQVTMRFSMDALMELRSSLNAQLAPMDVKLSVNDFIVRACALAMAKHPYFNSSWAGDRILAHQQVNIGVAIALDESRGGGLVVGVVKDADRKSLRQISNEVRALGEKARTKGLSIEEMSGATFTISNLGMFGVDSFTAIINPPNSAILACGAAIEQPVVRAHQLVVGWEMSATLSLDHRVIDGAMAAKYLQSLKQFVETPTLLLV
jgi:pyruvate dehydrogenase E2 component (dihydrolipoamide acetyltransferase)